MPRTAAFDRHHARYEEWFERHAAAYRSELAAVRAALPPHGLGLEIGVGTGRFAAPLGVRVGIEPSRPMLDLARKRGIVAVQGVAESLPFADGTFASVLVVTTICFVDNVLAMASEASRVLKPRGRIVVGFIDRQSPYGQEYLARRSESLFYREATFCSADEVDRLLSTAGFEGATWSQTLFGPVDECASAEPARPGRGEGSFVVVGAVRPDSR